MFPYSQKYPLLPYHRLEIFVILVACSSLSPLVVIGTLVAYTITMTIDIP